MRVLPLFVCIAIAVVSTATAVAANTHATGSANDANAFAFATPFTTQGSQILDATGRIVSLHCVNWPAHMETYLPEGLQYQNMTFIATNLIAGLGFNCVRLSFSVDLALSMHNSSVSPAFGHTPRSRLAELNLTSALAGFARHNPEFLDVPVLQVYDAAVAALSRAGVLVLLDNHISRAGWCCNANDGNGWFNDKYFSVPLWLEALGTMAARYSNESAVFAQDLRYRTPQRINEESEP